MEFLSQYDSQFVYVRGDRNSVADALSRRPTNFCSADAEKSASCPYPASLADEEDFLCHIFKPVDRDLLCAVTALSDITPDIQTPPFTFSISADQDFYACCGTAMIRTLGQNHSSPLYMASRI
jgi:hypothetical protein